MQKSFDLGMQSKYLYVTLAPTIPTHSIKFN